MFLHATKRSEMGEFLRCHAAAGTHRQYLKTVEFKLEYGKRHALRKNNFDVTFVVCTMFIRTFKTIRCYKCNSTFLTINVPVVYMGPRKWGEHLYMYTGSICVYVRDGTFVYGASEPV
jgi:hypothetical protein